MRYFRAALLVVFALATSASTSQAQTPVALSPPPAAQLPMLRAGNGHIYAPYNNGFVPLLMGNGDTLNGNLGVAPPTTTSTMNLQASPPANGAFFAGGGSYLQYCSVGGCVAGPHLFAEEANFMTTRFDASAQETVMAINLTSNTGATIDWTVNTAFAANTEVAGLTDGNIYKTSVSCTSGTTSPHGATSPQTDGTCSWTYIGLGLNNGKEGVSVAVNAGLNSGKTWDLDTEFTCASGLVSCIGYEQDSTYSGTVDRALGAELLIGIFQYGGGMSNPGTAAHYIGMGGAVPTYAWHYGTLVNGDNVVKDADFADATSATDAFYCLGAPHAHSDACMRDDSNSDTVLKTTGSHRVGLELSYTLFSSAIVLDMSPNDYITFNAGNNFMGYNSAAGCLTYGATNSGTTYAFESCNTGFFGIAGHLFSRGNAPTVVGVGCTSTLQVGSTDLAGTIIEGSGCTGDTLTFVQADTVNVDPFCVFQPQGSSLIQLTSYTPTTSGGFASGFTIGHASASGAKFTYHCMSQ